VEDFPFDEKHLIENLFLREFKDTVDDEELIWHQDREDRIITVLESNNTYYVGNRKKIFYSCYVFSSRDKR
jgi:hypothetical protein